MSLIYSPEKDSFLLKKVLIKKIPFLLKRNQNLKFLEMGIGSGILLDAAKISGIKKENIFGVDINFDAVKHCKNLGFNSVQSNLFEKIKGEYDLIIFNPPYLPLEFLEDEESKLITTGGKNGSEVINEFLIQSKKYLNKNGKIFLLVSSLTKKIDWNGFKKKLLIKEKIFFEELKVYELTL